MGEGRPTSMWDMGEDPMCVSVVKLLASDFLSLKTTTTNRNWFWRDGRQVRKAEIVGMVVSFERKDKFLKFHLDDGSACVPCILWLNHHYPTPPRLNISAHTQHSMLSLSLMQAQQIRLGRLVRVHGKITLYNRRLQITVSYAVAEDDPNAEILHWLDCISLAQHCYNSPPPTSK